MRPSDERVAEGRKRSEIDGHRDWDKLRRKWNRGHCPDCPEYPCSGPASLVPGIAVLSMSHVTFLG